MVEHLVYTEGVGGSSPSPPTITHTLQPPLRPPLRPPAVEGILLPLVCGIAVAGGQRAEIAQLVEHAPEERGVASSNLALGTISGASVRKWLSW